MQRPLVRLSASLLLLSCGDDSPPGAGATAPQASTGSTSPPETTDAPDPTSGELSTSSTSAASSTADSSQETQTDTSTGPTLDTCGDGKIDPGEVCDEGAADNHPIDYDGDDYNACLACAALRNFCGDGELQSADESCECSDDVKVCTTESGAECKNCQIFSRYVFVSSKRFHGNIGGVLSANATCKELAAASPFFAALDKGGAPPREWVAWLSDGCLAPRHFLDEGPDPSEDQFGNYRLTNNELVAKSFADLTTTNHPLVPILRDETGAQVDAGFVWTNVTVKGTPHPGGDDCDNWDSGSGELQGRVGYSGKTSVEWTLYNKEGFQTLACDSDAGYRIYCFEQ